MSGRKDLEDELFDDLQAEEERMAAEEQAELDSAEMEEAFEEAVSQRDPIEGMQSVIEKLNAENAELKDRALRIAAEMENLRRRTAKDVDEARSYAVSKFARDMLSVSDNLNRALAAVPQETREAGEPGLLALIEGVEMTEREMINLMGKNGVTKLEPKGQKFDPNFHQAMFEVQNPDVPNNSVMEVMQDGYVIGSRVLRPAMVGVAKGGPKFEAPKSEEPAAGDEPEIDGDFLENGGANL